MDWREVGLYCLPSFLIPFFDDELLLKNRVRKQWEALGSSDPYWAVLTHPEQKGGKWDKKTFFETGDGEVAAVLEKVSAMGIPTCFAVALDYGCGVGRLSRALASHFDRVIGVDISESMLDEARSANSAVPNLEFQRNSGEDLGGIADESVDFLYSNMVLQHSPPDFQRRLVGEFCRVLRPDGVLVFQTPSHINTRSLRGLAYLLLGNRLLNLARRVVFGKDSVMELHSLRDNVVRQLLAEGDAPLAFAERYDAAGAGFVSYRYFAVKR